MTATIVIVNTARMKKVYVVEQGNQVVCLPGATLDQLEKTLKPLGREPHSVIGSSCIGASVFGGVCNNSGGALVHRGPAYTQMAVFGQIDANGELHLVNHLGVRLGSTPEDILGPARSGETFRMWMSSVTQARRPTTTMRAMCERSMRIRPRASTRTLIVCTKLRDPPASSWCSRFGSIPFRSSKVRKCSISAPTSPMN